VVTLHITRDGWFILGTITSRNPQTKIARLFIHPSMEAIPLSESIMKNLARFIAIKESKVKKYGIDCCGFVSFLCGISSKFECDNTLINLEKRKIEFVQEMWTVCDYAKFHQGKLESTSDPFMECGDVLFISDKDFNVIHWMMYIGQGWYLSKFGIEVIGILNTYDITLGSFGNH
jgi:hypothetical protein